MSIKVIAAAAALLTAALSGEALAQVSQVVTTPPAKFAACKESPPVGTFAYGQKRVFTDCTPTRTNADYGRVYVRYSPPSRTPFAGLSNGKKRQVLRTLREFFLPNSNAGVVILNLTLVRADGTEVPLDAIPLTSFSYDENNGLRYAESERVLSSNVGYRFRLSGGQSSDSVKVQFMVAYTRNTTSNITGVVSDVSKATGAIGLLSPLSDVVLAPFKGLETKITAQGAIDSRSEFTPQLSFDPAGNNGMLINFHLEPGLPDDGYLFVALQREISIFSDAFVDNGAVKFKIAGTGVNSNGPIREAFIGGRRLEDLVREPIVSDYWKLASLNPDEFTPVCNTAWNTIQNMNLTRPDKAAAFWALFVSNSNATNKAIQESPCIARQISDRTFSDYALPLPPIKVGLTDAFIALSKQVEAAAGLAVINAEAASRAEGLARNFAAGALLTPSAPNTERVVVEGISDYAGQKRVEGQTFTGVNKTLSGELQEYFGEMITNGADGSGVLRYADGGPRRQYLGAFKNNAPNGAGELDFADGSVYYGEFAAGAPSGLGKLIKPDGTEQTGYFRDAHLQGRGIETKDDKLRFGHWAHGVLVSTAN